jgi:hypothetical protein
LVADLRQGQVLTLTLKGVKVTLAAAVRRVRRSDTSLLGLR